jgi:hypothetical protein
VFTGFGFGRTALIALALAVAGLVHAAIPETLGWYELPNTKLRAFCPSSTTYPNIVGGSGCAGVTQAWGGAAFDEIGNRMLITGGGHTDWGGNEVYEVDLDTGTMRRINNPSYPVRDGCAFNSIYADGRPVARHTYNQLEYLPGANLLFMFSGSRWNCGGFGGDTWTFDPASDHWTQISSALHPREEFSLSVVRDPVSGLLYARDTNEFYSYHPTTQQWSVRSDNEFAISAYKQAVIDPHRRRYFMYIANDRHLYSYDISSTTASSPMVSAITTGCSFMDSDAVGWAYDPVLDRLIAWDGGDAVQVLNPDTATCTTLSYPGGPTKTDTGTYGRFRYSPTSGVYLSCNKIDDNCRTLRLTTARIFANGFE